MKIEITQNCKTVVVAIAGRLDTLTSSELEQELRAYFSDSELHLVLDCGASLQSNNHYRHMKVCLSIICTIFITLFCLF